MTIGDLRGDARGATGAAALLWLLVTALVVALLLHERRVELTRAEATARPLTMVMQAHTESTFHTVDRVLAGLSDAYQVLDPPPSHETLRALLRSPLQRPPAVPTLSI